MIEYGKNASVNGDMEIQSFDMLNCAKGFHILISRIYTKKIEAVIREVLCNAYDAQIQAGNEHIPVQVTLPSIIDPHFKVRDIGIGLRPDQMGMYTTLFQSSKEEEEAQTGYYGLGSKSPFAYSSTFNITTYYEGIRRQYSAVLDGKSVPKLVKMTEEASSEPTGVEISVPVAAQDFRAFQQAYEIVAQWFNVTPDAGIEVQKPNISTNSRTIASLNLSEVDELVKRGVSGEVQVNEYRNGGIHLVMGNVGYQVSFQEVNSHIRNANMDVPSSMVRFISDLSGYVRVPNGSVDIPPSRETVEYTPKTLDFLVDLYKEIFKGVSALVATKIRDESNKSLTNYYNNKTMLNYFNIKVDILDRFRVLVNKLNSTTVMPAVRSMNTVSWNIVDRATKHNAEWVENRHFDQWTRFLVNLQDRITSGTVASKKIYIGDKIGWYNVAKKYANESRDTFYMELVKLKPKVKAVTRHDEEATFFEDLKNIILFECPDVEFVMTSTLPKIDSTETPPVVKYRNMFWDLACSKKEYDGVDEDVQKGPFFILPRRNDTVYYKDVTSEVNMVGTLITLLKEAKVIPDNTTVWTLPVSDYHLAKKIIPHAMTWDDITLSKDQAKKLVRPLVNHNALGELVPGCSLTSLASSAYSLLNMAKTDTSDNVCLKFIGSLNSSIIRDNETRNEILNKLGFSKEVNRVVKSYYDKNFKGLEDYANILMIIQTGATCYMESARRWLDVIKNYKK